MKWSNSLILFALLYGVGLLMNGCIWKSARVPARHFVLTPIPASKPAPVVARPVEVEVGLVKMPSYLLRESLALRKSANEFEYLDNAQWAERLDRCFRRTLTENLSTLLSSDGTHPSFSEGTRLTVMVSVDVKQFDVDTQGRGTLLATWRITRSGSDELVKSGHSHLNEIGPSPRDNPQVVATTLSGLIAQFSRELAEGIRASTSDQRHESNREEERKP